MATQPEASTAPEPYLWAKVLSRSPLVTISLTNWNTPAGVMSVAGDLIGTRPGLHLFHHPWSLEMGEAAIVSKGVQEAGSQFPHSEFLMLGSNEMEVLDCTEAGLPAIVGSGLIMVNERVWYPRPVVATETQYDAVYNGRLDPFKRHELAAKVDKLLLIYGPAVDSPPEEAFQRAKRLLPAATFANHEAGKGAYKMISNARVAELFAQSRVALCLSAIEGCMRGSIEYLLCGLPIVSTRSVGGRDRYFGTSYCTIVPTDDPEAIAHAVRTLRDRNLDRLRIREHVGQVLAFERYNFLLTLNAVVRRQFGLDHDLFTSFEPFLGVVSLFQSASQIRQMITQELSQA